MILTIIAGAAALLLFALAMRGPQLDDLRWREVHHEYIGLILLLIGIALRSLWVASAGAALMVDDAIQHAFQRWGGTSSRISLVHWLYGVTFYRWRLMQRLNAWLDEEADG
jgi:multisubunit Na+/H+ antiporter MnhB subunit